VVVAGASVLVRHISTALTGRETNGGNPYGVSSRSRLLSFVHGRRCSLPGSLSADSLRVPSVCCVQVVAGVLEVFPSDTTMCGDSDSSAPWTWSTPEYTVAAV